MDVILMDYASDPQLGKLKEEKLTSIKSNYSSTWTCTHIPQKVSYSLSVGYTNPISVIVGNTKIIPIGDDLDCQLIMIGFYNSIKTQAYQGTTVKDRHNQTIAKTWQS